MASNTEGRPELSWYNKALISNETGWYGYAWVNPVKMLEC